MAKRTTLRLASPLAVGKALSGTGGYHFGIPDNGLIVSLYSEDVFVPFFTQDGSLKAGDWIVDTLEHWLDFLLNSSIPGDIAQAFVARFTKGKRASLAFTILGYFPIRLQIPEVGAMAYKPHGKIVLMGQFGASGGSPVEQWSASMSYDVIGPDEGLMPATISEGALTAIATAWGAVISASTTGSKFTDNVTLEEVAYYRAQSDGTATGGVWQRYFIPSPPRGPSAEGYKPLQVATVITLDAGGARGGRFGRFYLPFMAENIDTGGRYLASAATGLLTKVQTALTTTNTTLNGEGGFGDVELVVASGKGDGSNRPVRFLRCGRVPDTMRSRRTSLDEDYSISPFQSIP